MMQCFSKIASYTYVETKMAGNEKLATSIVIELNNGKKIPALGFGTAAPESDYERIPEAVLTAYESGFRHIDTAWYYGTEPYIGKALKQLFDRGVKREDLFITTKVWPALHDRPEKSLDKSLSDLGIDYVDLFLQHWPVCYKTDENGLPKNPYDENGVIQFDKEADWLDTYKKMIHIYKNTDKVRSIGVSNFNIHHLQRVLDETDIVPVYNQLELHPKIPSKELVKFCEDHGIKVAAYSPFGSQGAPLIRIPIVKELARKYKVSENVILESYHLQSGRIVIARSSTPERIRKLIQFAPLVQEELALLDDVGVQDPQRFIQEDWGVQLGFPHWKKKPSWEEKDAQNDK